MIDEEKKEMESVTPIKALTYHELESMTYEQIKKAFLQLATQRKFMQKTIGLVINPAIPEWCRDSMMSWFLQHPYDDEKRTLDMALWDLD